eukprot:3408837-Rhodomonas_salina.1
MEALADGVSSQPARSVDWQQDVEMRAAELQLEARPPTATQGTSTSQNMFDLRIAGARTPPTQRSVGVTAGIGDDSGEQWVGARDRRSDEDRRSPQRQSLGIQVSEQRVDNDEWNGHSRRSVLVDRSVDAGRRSWLVDRSVDAADGGWIWREQRQWFERHPDTDDDGDVVRHAEQLELVNACGLMTHHMAGNPDHRSA